MDDGRVVKELDHSSFTHRISTIHKPFYVFFGMQDDDKKIILYCENNKYEADLKWSRPDSPVVRISWGKSFDDILKDKFTNWRSRKPRDKVTGMKLVFKKTISQDIFEVKLIDEYSFENGQIDFALKVSSKIKKSPSKPKGSIDPRKKNVSSEQIIRDPDVHAWVLHNSRWICECCNEPSPFSKEDGSMYLEVHHLKRLADGGSDTIENAIAVCPNCHRELHYGLKKEEKLKTIYQRIKRTKKE